MLKKQLLEQVLNNKIYKKLAEKLPEDQRKIVEERLEIIAQDYSKSILEKFSKVTKDGNAKKAVEEIFNNQTVVNEKTGKVKDE